VRLAFRLWLVYIALLPQVGHLVFTDLVQNSCTTQDLVCAWSLLAFLKAYLLMGGVEGHS